MGINTRLDTNPGESLTSTGVLFSAFTTSTTFTTVSSAVSTPRTTSTNGIIGTGFMKCIPITWAGRLVCAASAVIEMDDVLLARIAPAGATRSSSRKMLNLVSGFSVAASTTSSASFAASSLVLVAIRASIPADSAPLTTPFFTWRSTFALIAATPRAKASGTTSISRVSHPACAKTCAMPLPMVPAPTTATRLMQTKRAPSEARAEGSDGVLQDQHGDGQLAQVAQQDQHEAGEDAEGDPAPPPLAPVGHDGARGERSNGIGEEIAARGPEQPRHADERHGGREHGEARGAEREVEREARGAEPRSQQTAHQQHGEGLQRHRDGGAGERHGHLCRSGDERRPQNHCNGTIDRERAFNSERAFH